jgi:L-lactate dehydrogenase complex protein LldF
VRINIHEQLYAWRRIIAAGGLLPGKKRLVMRLAGVVLGSPALYRLSTALARTAVRILPRGLLYTRLNGWGRDRELPTPPSESFASWHARRKKAG